MPSCDCGGRVGVVRRLFNVVIDGVTNQWHADIMMQLNGVYRVRSNTYDVARPYVHTEYH